MSDAVCHSVRDTGKTPYQHDRSASERSRSIKPFRLDEYTKTLVNLEFAADFGRRFVRCVYGDHNFKIAACLMLDRPEHLGHIRFAAKDRHTNAYTRLAPHETCPQCNVAIRAATSAGIGDSVVDIPVLMLQSHMRHAIPVQIRFSRTRIELTSLVSHRSRIIPGMIRILDL